MHNNIIDVFNQLTDSQLADCRLFQNIILSHYEKFKYFYSIIENISLNTINSIRCLEEPCLLNIFITFKNKKELNKFIQLFRTSKNKYFLINTTVNVLNLNISIENNQISREEEIYENRFNTN